jgi:cytochrome c553
MKTVKVIAGLALTLVVGGGAQAAGDPERGRYLADTCLGCHNVSGYTNAYPTYNVPKVWGQHAAYLESALKAYRAGDRPHKTMQAQAMTLSDQDIADIAAFFAQ